MSIFKNLLKDTFLYGLATVLPRLMNLVLVKLHTSTLTKVSYAENTSFYVYAAFANVILTYGLETAFFRFYTLEKKNKKVFSTVLISLSTTTLLFSFFCFFFQENIANWVKLPVKQLQILLGILIFDTLTVSAFILYRIQGKVFKYIFIKLFSITVITIGNFYFLWAVPKYGFTLPYWLKMPNVLYVFVSNLIASLGVLLLVLPTYFKFKLSFSKDLLIKMLNYGWPIMVAGLAYTINENLDKLVLRDFLGKDIMGAYSGCYKLSVFLMLFIQAFRMGVEPFIFKQAHNKNAKETYAVVMKFFVIFASLGVLFVICFLDFFKEIMIDETYWEAIKIVPIILVANWCLGVYHSLSVWYKLTNKTHFGMYFSIFGAIVTIVLNYAFVPKYGFMAAAYATLAAYGSMMLISYFFGQRYYTIPYPKWRLLCYLGIALVLSFINLNVLPNILVVKLISILIYLGIIFIFEKDILKPSINK